MFFHSLAEILAKIPEKPGWERYQQYRQLLECWQAVVSPETAKKTRPLYIKRQVLFVATSSSVWAQELSLKRYALLKQLNNRLALSLKDIRFTSYQWQQTGEGYLPLTQTSQVPKSLHPSRININDIPIAAENLPLVDDPQGAVKNWLDVIQARSSKLSVCPQCKSPTPEGELKRWSLCCHCAAKNWSEK